MTQSFETVRITNPGFPEYPQGFDYLNACIRNAKAGSTFGQKLKELPESDNEERLRLLLVQNYDGILFLRGEEIIGHVFFQKHVHKVDGVPIEPPTETWHLFSVTSHDEGNGNGREFLTEFLRVAKDEGATRVQLGAGGNGWVNAFWREARDGKLNLPFPFTSGFGMWELEFPTTG